MNIVERINALLSKLSAEDKKNFEKLPEEVAAHLTEMTNKLQQEEALKNDAIATRDKAKIQLNDIKSALNVTQEATKEEVQKSLDALKSTSDKESKKGDAAQNDALEIAAKDIENLKKEITKMNEDHTAETASLQNAMSLMSVSGEITKYGAELGVKKTAYPMITRIIQDSITVEKGKLVFKNHDGTQMRTTEGKDMDVRTFMQSMKGKEVESKESLFFDTKVEQSGNTVDPLVQTQPASEISGMQIVD